MNGIILVNKEKNYSSRDVVNIISKKFNIKKVGHFGTLDPLATGLLIIGIGKYTKFQKLLANEDKTYEVEVLLGTSTDTYDITGNIIESKELIINKDYLTSSLLSFKKNYKQTVPIYSATKVNGKKLYEYARNNESVKLPTKEVNIYDIYDISYIEKDNNIYLRFTTDVNKGTYIRSLINDLSKKTNIPMCMSGLNRTKISDFLLKDSYTIEEINNNKYSLVDINKLLNYKKIDISSELENQINNGSLIDNKYDDSIVIFTKNNTNIVAYKIYEKDSSKMKPLFFF